MLLDLHRLEAALECGIIPDSFPVFVRQYKLNTAEGLQKEPVYSRVVAPTSGNPRAKVGLIIFPAFIEPSAFPRFSNVSLERIVGDLMVLSSHRSRRKVVDEADNPSSRFFDVF